MNIKTIERKSYDLLEHEKVLGRLFYTNHFMMEADVIDYVNAVTIFLRSNFSLSRAISFDKDLKEIVQITKKTKNLFLVSFLNENKEYTIKMNGLWKTHFTIINAKGEELFILIPLISFTKKLYDFTLRIDQLKQQEINPILVLHALHCVNSSLSMLNGSVTSAIK
jgi:hypothetical protein